MDKTFEAACAFCLHPLAQHDEDLKSFKPRLYDPWIVMLVMEYRNIANAGLRHAITGGVIKTSVVPEVNDMLMADKIQNYKDFKLHNKYHSDAIDLEYYFKKWHKTLGIDTDAWFEQIKNWEGFGMRLRPLEEWERECVMTWAEFVENVQCGAITDEDGSAYFGQEVDGVVMRSPVEIPCITRKLLQSDITPPFTHILWYNK